MVGHHLITSLEDESRAGVMVSFVGVIQTQNGMPRHRSACKTGQYEEGARGRGGGGSGAFLE